MTARRRTRRAVIVGAGVGGLAVGVALSRVGWQVTILEQAQRLEPVGSGISLAHNAVRALDALNLGRAVREQGWVMLGTGLRQPSGRWLSRTGQGRAARVVLLHRADLIDLLSQALPADALRTGWRVDPRTVTLDGAGPVAVRHADATLDADLLVAADGVHSALRARMLPGQPAPRYAGYTTWRLVVDLDLPPGSGTGAESWGRGERFGLARLPDGRTYAYASAATTAGGRRNAAMELAELRHRFGAWHEPIPAVLAAATTDAVLRTDVYEQRPPLSTYVAGPAVLLGDAAHAMAPDLGQGGGQALEDAVTLAAAVTAEPDVPAALAHYNRLRLRRTQHVVRYAHAVATAVHRRNRLAVLLRDAALAAVPPTVAARSLDRVVRWTPPPLGPTSESATT